MQFMITRVLRYIVLGFTIFCLFLASLFWYCFSNDVCSVKWLYIPFHNRTSPTFYWRKLRSSHQYEIHSYVKMENFVTRDNSSFPTQGTSYDKLFVGQSEFDIKGSDVIVFLHIQNTGGSVFSRHIIEDLSLERPCHCRKNRRSCVCYRPNKYGSPWLFSRYTMGWKCGVHPDWTELSSCVDRVMDEEEGKPVKRRYFFITVLRDPLKRFLSEFWHSKQGQNWPTNHWCEELDNDLPSCFDDMNAMDLSLDDFMACPYNLAINRQTRMLSDMSLIGCYNSSLPKEDVDLIMFASAKSNLHKMAFFGLSEFPKISQYMFETSFNLNFRFKEQPLRNSIFRSARKMLFKGLNTKQVKKIKHINNLDVELYQYAKKLLFYRFEKLKNQDPSFENNFQEMNEKNVYTEDWADKEDLIDSHNS